MSDTFRDAICEEINGLAVGSGYYATRVAWDEAREAGAAILAMPEMQAIKQFISRMANPHAPKMDRGKRQMEVWGLPESVIDWVLGDAT